MFWEMKNSREVNYIPNIQWFKQYLPTISDFNVLFRFWRPIAFKRYNSTNCHCPNSLTSSKFSNFQKCLEYFLLSLITWANLRFKLKSAFKQKGKLYKEVLWMDNIYSNFSIFTLFFRLSWWQFLLSSICRYPTYFLCIVSCTSFWNCSTSSWRTLWHHYFGSINYYYRGCYYCFANDYRGWTICLIRKRHCIFSCNAITEWCGRFKLVHWGAKISYPDFLSTFCENCFGLIDFNRCIYNDFANLHQRWAGTLL